MALDGEDAAARERSPQGLRRQGSVELATPVGSKLDQKTTVSQPALRRVTDPLPEHSQENLAHRSQSLRDLREHTPPPLARRSSTKELAEAGSQHTGEPSPAGEHARRWFGKKAVDKLPGSLVGALDKKDKGWGLGKVVARHQWLTDEGDDDTRRNERPESSSKKAGLKWGAAGRSVQQGLAFRRPSSRRGSDSDDSSQTGHLAKGGSETAVNGGAGSRQLPPAVPRPPQAAAAALDEMYRKHYLPHAPAEALGERIESMSAPVKFFPGGSRAGNGGLDEAAGLLGERQAATGLASEGGGGSSGPSMGSIAEHDSSQQLLHSEIEAVRAREEGGAPGPRKSSFRRESGVSQAGLGEENVSGYEESGTPRGRQRDAGKKDGTADPFDNQFDPLPGTEAYGMTQVEDDETIQNTTQGGDGLGAQFKAT